MQAAATLDQPGAPPRLAWDPEDCQRIGGDALETERDLLNLLFFCQSLPTSLCDQPHQKRGDQRGGGLDRMPQWPTDLVARKGASAYETAATGSAAFLERAIPHADVLIVAGTFRSQGLPQEATKSKYLDGLSLSIKKASKKSLLARHFGTDYQEIHLQSSLLARSCCASVCKPALLGNP